MKIYCQRQVWPFEAGVDLRRDTWDLMGEFPQNIYAERFQLLPFIYTRLDDHH